MKSSTATTIQRVPWYIGPAIDLEPEELDALDDTGLYVEEPKVDGIWSYLETRVPELGQQNILKSRDATTAPIQSDNAGDLLTLEMPTPPGTVLVGELEASTQWATAQVAERGYRRIHLYDLPKVGVFDLRNKPWIQRRQALEELYAKHILPNDLLRSRFPLVPYVTENFRATYEAVIAAGYEGVVLKKILSLYTTGRADGKTDDWMRCKRWLTWEYVLSGIGMTPGGKYSAPKPTGEWGLFKNGKLVKVMQAACPPEYLRPENVGVLVGEFKGWVKFKSGALRHAQWVRLRTDKEPVACTP